MADEISSAELEKWQKEIDTFDPIYVRQADAKRLLNIARQGLEANRLLRQSNSALMIADRSDAWRDERDKLVAKISEYLATPNNG